MPVRRPGLRATLSGLALAGATLVPFSGAGAGPVLVVDAATGQVLKAEEATRPWHPASTTKMMTAYVALKAVKAGRIGLETAIPASALAAKQPRVKVYIKAGQEVTLDNAMKIMMVKSANDISYVIAEGIGGSVENFVAMMNAEARRLGMSHTQFTNPNGWHDPAQQTSARDLAILAIALMRDFPEYAHYWDIGAVQLGKQRLNNTNGLVGRYSGINGFKTGFVCASGFNVVASATRGGRTLIAVVLGALSGAERTVVAAQALDEGFGYGGAWSGFGGTSLASLPHSGYSSASSICAQVRARGGGAILADDFEAAGPIAYQQAAVMSDNGMGDRFGPAPAAERNATARAGNRYVLGPRAEMAALPVGFGRTAGSANAPLAANVARRGDTQLAGAPAQAGNVQAGRARTLSPNGAIPVSASAFAATGPAGSPMKLQGAGAATQQQLRPGAAAGIRPKPAPARAQQAKVDAKPDSKAAAKPKAEAKAKAETKAKQAKASSKPQAKPAQKPKPKPQDD